MNKPRSGFSVLELLVVLWVFALLFSFVNPTGGFAFLAFAAVATVLLAIGLGIARGWKALVLTSIPALIALVPIVLLLPTVFPTQFSWVHGGGFERSEFASVLSQIASEKDGWPKWRFRLPDRELAQKRITVAIPAGCRLTTALELMADAADCEYDWHWFSFCGNAPPTRAVFCFHPRGTKSDRFAAGAVNIDSDLVWQDCEDGRFEYRDGVWQPGK